MFRITLPMKRPDALTEKAERIRRLHQLPRTLAENQLPLHLGAGALPDTKIDRLTPSIQ